jgi:hypothetical protein
MAIIFDEITGSIEPNGQQETGDQALAPAAPTQNLKPAMIRRAMNQMRQRESRLRAS